MVVSLKFSSCPWLLVSAVLCFLTCCNVFFGFGWNWSWAELNWSGLDYVLKDGMRWAKLSGAERRCEALCGISKTEVGSWSGEVVPSIYLSTSVLSISNTKTMFCSVVIICTFLIGTAFRHPFSHIILHLVFPYGMSVVGYVSFCLFV